MDRSSYDAPTRSGRAEQEAIGYAPATPAMGQRWTEDRPHRAEPRGRLGGLRDQVGELTSIRSFDDVEERIRAHPVAALAIAAGIGLVLHRTNLLDSVAGSDDDVDYELTPQEDRLLAWLNDAYALERAQIPILKNHAADARSQPHVRRKDLEHLEQTKQHAKMVKECIALLGRKPSRTKSVLGRMAGAMNSVTTEPFDDEIVRNFLADFASENLEIASYEAIIVAARDAGHERIARICEDILEDEEEMVDWLRSNLPRAVRDTLGELDISQSRRS